MKKFLLSLLCAVGMMGANAAQEKTLTFDFSDSSNAQGIVTTASSTGATKSITGTSDDGTSKFSTDLTLVNTYWQKNSSNSYIYFNKNAGTEYSATIAPISGIKVTSVNVFIPTGTSNSASFSLTAGEHKYDSKFSVSTAGNKATAIKLDAADQSGVSYKIKSEQTSKVSGISKIILTYVEDEGGSGTTEPDPVTTLGTIKVNGNAVEDGDEIPATVGDVITFSAENATMITYEAIDDNDSNNKADGGEEASEVSWPITTAGKYLVTVEAVNDDDEDSKIFYINATEKSGVEPEPDPVVPTPGETYTDVITIANFSKITTTTYTDDTYTSTISGVTYKVKLSNSKDLIQLNKDSDKGIIVSENKNGYILESIKIEAHTATANRTINIRGNATVLTEINSTDGTSIGALTLANTDTQYEQTFTPEYDYQAFSIKGSGGAFFIDKITVVWKKSARNNLKDAGLSFSESVVNYDINDNFEAQTLSNPNTLEVTWSSSDKKVATIDATSGAISIVGTGSTIIKADFAGNETTNPGSAQYTLNVSDRTITNVVFDFTAKEYGMTRYTTGSEMNPDPVVFNSEDGWIGAVATGRSRIWNNNGLRVYGGTIIEFYTPETCELVAAKVLNADGSENSARTKEFKIEGQVATYTCGLQATSNTDLPKIQISYKGVAEEDIQAAFAASEKFTVTINGEVASDGTHAKTSQADAVVSLKHHYPHAKVYHKWTPVQNGGTNQVIRREPMEGFTEHTEALSLATAGTLQYYAELNGLQTPVQTLTVTGATTTSIAEISADKAAAIYDLQGRKVSKGGRGLFIQGGKVVRF